MSLLWDRRNRKITITQSNGEDVVKNINQAIDSLVEDNWTMIIEEGEYDCSGNTIEITHPITMISSNRDNTILNNGNIVISASNVEIQNLTIKASNFDNAIRTKVVESRKDKISEIKNIKIKNCYAEAKLHAYLFEEYGIDVSDVEVYNCVAQAIETVDIKDTTKKRMSYHGFISKAKNVSFIECKAYGFSSYGFGIVSENDPKSTILALAEGNVVKDCQAKDCSYGLSMYCRLLKEDFGNITQEEVEKILYSKNHNINNFVAKKCKYPVEIGRMQIVEKPEEAKYMYSPIQDSVFDDIKISINSTTKNSIVIYNVKNCKFNNISVE